MFTIQTTWVTFFYSVFAEIVVHDENPHKQTNLESIQSLDKTSRITALNWDNDGGEILVGRVKPVVRVYSLEKDNFLKDAEVSEGSVVGLAKFNGKLVAGLSNGNIQIGTGKKAQIISAGDAMTRFRQCPVERKLIATGGKERQNNLKVWSLETNECVFKTKNVPNDFLQLEVPIWDNDFGFIDANSLTTCSRYGYVRVYDMRQQRRPALNFVANENTPISFTSLATHSDEVFVGTTTGVMHAFDLRKMKVILHTYKGFSGSISDVTLDKKGEHVCTASLDRFVRVHDTESTALMYQCYVKSKATRVLLRDVERPEEDVVEEVEDVVESSDDEDIEGDGGNSSADPEEDDVDEFDAIFDNMPTVE